MTVTHTTSSTGGDIVNLTPAPYREPRCRYLNRLGDPCVNPSLDPDPNAIQICVRHVREVLDLLREHRARYQAAQENT